MYASETIIVVKISNTGEKKHFNAHIFTPNKLKWED